MKCYAYVRVSTKEQDEEVQKRAIEEFAKSKGIEIVEWFIDKGVSGAVPAAQRPAFKEMLNKLQSSDIKCVVAWALDRLGRSMLDTLTTVQRLEESGVRVITVKEEFLQILDPSIRSLILTIFAWVAEQERRRIRERQEEAWKQGKQKGRPPKLPTNTLLKYLEKCKGLSLKDIWKIMKADGINVSYYTVVKKVKELRKQGVIK